MTKGWHMTLTMTWHISSHWIEGFTRDTFLLRFGLANAINTYLKLKIRVVLREFESDLFLYRRISEIFKMNI